MTDNERQKIEDRKTIERIREEQGWNDSTMLSLAMNYIETALNGDLMHSFALRMEKQQAEENEA